MSADLSPCPFCRGAAYASAYLNSRKVVCDHCGASTLDCPTATMAAELWNARPAPAKVDPAPGTVRVKMTLTVGQGWVALMSTENVTMIWSERCENLPHRGDDYGRIVTLIADLPLPSAPVVVVGTVETS